MDAKELRIGNFIFNSYYKREEQCYKITNTSELRGMKINTFRERFISPIELTEEWVLKFGFKKRYDYWRLEGQWFKILRDMENQRYMWFFSTGLGGGNAIKLKYVHQLQNLYFALTGEELTFKI